MKKAAVWKVHCSATVTASTACIMIKIHGLAKIGALVAVTVAEQCTFHTAAFFISFH